MRRFEYRPTARSKPRLFEIAEGRLRHLDAEGAEQWRVELGAVDKAVLIELATDGIRMLRLDLRSMGGWRSVRIDHPLSSAVDDPDRTAHRELLPAIFSELPETAGV